MSQSTTQGPFSGAEQCVVMARQGLSAASEKLLGVIEAPYDLRLLSLRIRSNGVGTGTITAFKLRKAAAGNTLVTSGGTQMLSADGGAIAAQATAAVEPEGTTPTLATGLTGRDVAKGEQVGVFITTDGGTANDYEAVLTFFPKGHVRAKSADEPIWAT